MPIKQTKHCGVNQYAYTHIYIVFHKKMSVIIFKRLIEKDPTGKCQYRNIKHCRVVDVLYKDWKESGKAWLMVRWFLIFHGKIGFEIFSKKLWGLDNVQNVPIKKTKDCGDNQYIHIYTLIYIFFHKNMGVIVFKRMIKKDPIGRYQYGNIKHCGIVYAFYKDWKNGGKAWLIVRWFLIFHGKTSIEIFP